MKLFDLIYQTEVDEVIDNSEDNLPNKIKEKEESLQNTLIKRLGIPFHFKNKEANKVEEDTDEDEVSYSVIEDSKVVEDEMEQEEATPNGENYTEDEYSKENYNSEDYSSVSVGIKETEEESVNTKIYDIINRNGIALLEGKEKPINVKNSMITNIRKKNVDEVDYGEIENYSEVETKPNAVSDDVVVEESNIEKPKIELGETGLPSKIEKTLSGAIDLDSTIVEINETREKVMNVSEQANIAANAALESDKLLREVSDEYSEAEKQLKETEMRSQQMEQRILTLLMGEKDRLTKQLQDQESIITDANRRKEQNDDKIVDFRSRINSTLEKTNEVNEKILRQEEMLSALGGYDNSEFKNYDTDDEKTSRRVA